MLWALENFFLQRNHDDAKGFSSDGWNNLKGLGSLLEAGDTVVTFNYDSTIERVLFHTGKWAPSDGYGTDLVFQMNAYDTTPAKFPPSKVKVLYLHGAAGWYAKPVFSPTFEPTAERGGAIPLTALSPAPLDTEISIDPLLLQGLGIYNVDASLPRRPPQERQVMLHPSFLKEYDPGNGIFSRLWKMALDSLRNAEEVVVIGYSLPPADSAAWTLLHTGCEPQRTVVVNPSRAELVNRYSRLVISPIFAETMGLGTWLDSKRGPARVSESGDA